MMKKVVSVDNMRRSDAYTIAHFTPSRTLMERAGRGIFDEVSRTPHGWKPPVAIVCGAGNNAGDGFVAAALLMEAGIPCTVFLLSDRFSEDGAYFFSRLEAPGADIRRGADKLDLAGYETILDCLLGTGFSGELREPFRTAVEKINEAGKRAFVVSADINSGLGGDSGLGFCVRSDLTVSIGSFKYGLFLNDAKDVIGEKVNCEIGIEPLAPPAELPEASDLAPLFPKRANNCNKGDFGYVALIGGSVLYSGAAKLANLSLAALRSGAGVSKLAVPKSITQAVLPYLLESTLFPLDADENGGLRFDRAQIEQLLFRTKAAAVGMGMGRSPETEKLLRYALTEYDGRLVIDADGLNTLAGLDRSLMKNSPARLILTPHLKEFERLCGVPMEVFRNDLVRAAKTYAAETGAILLLKGPTTIVTDGETVYLVDRGCAGMATAGSGDVLSGILAGLCGFVPDDRLLLGVAAGAYLNGLAGELAARDVPEISMLSGDTVRHIPDALRTILGE